MNTNVLTAPPAELKAVADAIVKHDAAERHWSRLAVILGRMEDEKLSKAFGYGSSLAYAYHELGMSLDEHVVLLGLWKMVKAAAGVVALEQWEKVPKTHAVIIRRALSLGADLKTWLGLAGSMTADALRQRLDRELGGKEPWTTVKLSVPTDLSETFEACLIVALPEALGAADPDPALAKSRAARHLCLEVVLRNFAQTYPGLSRSTP